MKRHNAKRHSSLRFLSLAAGLAFGFFVLAFWMSGRFVPGVRIGPVSVGGLTMMAARERLSAWLTNPSLAVVTGDQRWDFSPADVGIVADIDSALNNGFRFGRTWSQGYAVPLRVAVDKASIERLVAAIGDSIGDPPVDASLIFREKGFSVLAGSAGVVVDRTTFGQDIETAMRGPRPSVVTLRLLEQEPDVDLSDVQPLIDRATAMMNRAIQVRTPRATVTVDPAALGSWIAVRARPNDLEVASSGPTVLPPDAFLTLDRQKIAAWLESRRPELELEPSTRRVLAAKMRTEVVDPGQPGFRLDLDSAVVALDRHVASGSVDPLELPTIEAASPVTFLDAPSAPIPIGKVIAVDLTVQHAYLYEDGVLVYSMPISSGINDWTPTGTFRVYAKTKKQKMSGPDYYVPNVPNILWFKGDYSLHGVYWHDDFGIRPRSHGCVGQSVEDSEFTYAWGEVGTPIVIAKS